VEEQVRQLARALDATGTLIGSVREDQWGDPTPCTDWSVGDLVSHLTTGNYGFARALSGSAPESGGGRAEAYRASAAAVTEAFSQPGALARVVTVPFGTVPGVVALHLRITEVLTHGWDLARATGQPADLPEDLAEQELAFTLAKLGDVPQDRRPFAPPRAVSPGAPAIDRLAACLGRDVTP
jgi:uncharacterized protein (TIGR03086 family)